MVDIPIVLVVAALAGAALNVLRGASLAQENFSDFTLSRLKK